MSDPADKRREDARRFADDLIDYAIYAPLGAAIAVAEELPELVRRGRERFGPRIALAQMLGKVAADSARRRVEGFVRRPADRPLPLRSSGCSRRPGLAHRRGCGRGPDS